MPEETQVECGWLLDDGLLCIGVGRRGNLDFVTYTSPCAIRFPRKIDALLFRQVISGTFKLDAMFNSCHPVEHQWG